eukprot:COSAG01_NODE_64457_length_276_cov_0.875706_1_plen_65_part_01
MQSVHTVAALTAIAIAIATAIATAAAQPDHQSTRNEPRKRKPGPRTVKSEDCRLQDWRLFEYYPS